MAKKRKKFIVTENHEYKETDMYKFRICTVVSEVSSFVGQPVPVGGRVVSIDRLEQF